MNTEYEIKILDINPQDIKIKLDKLGAKFIGEFFQKRYVYKLEDNNCIKKWIRLRTDGYKVTLAIKKIIDYSTTGTKEIEFEVSDLPNTQAFLDELGYTCSGYQENKRIKYILNNVEICIDIWPQIPAYIEIEGETEKEVLRVLELMGYNKDNIYTGKETVYFHYGKNVDLSNIKF